MADFQHWRRMINLSKARPPTVEHTNVISTSPKRTLRPQLPSLLSYPPIAKDAPKVEPRFELASRGIFDVQHTLDWSGQYIELQPAVHTLIECIMQRLLNCPFDALDTRHNGMILRICEEYRANLEEQKRLRGQVDEQQRTHNALMQGFQQAQKRWSEERLEYKAEVKRLELLLAKGNQGLAGVTLARQDSVLRQRVCGTDDDGLETVFEFLERSQRADERVWDAQRATFRKRLPSPCAGMRHLSQQLGPKQSMTNIHADLPFGTPPNDRNNGFALAYSQSENSRDNKLTDTDPSEPRTSVSDDSYAMFSCSGDWLPNKASDGTLVESTNLQDDMAFIKVIAERLSQRRHIDSTELIPMLFELFALSNTKEKQSHLVKEKRSASAPNALLFHSAEVKATALERLKPGMKHPSVIKKASGFFQRKWRPHTNLRITTDVRRFSFETGDDASLGLGTGHHGQVRKSASMSSLPTPRAQPASVVNDDDGGRPLSVIHSPTISTRTSSSRRMSGIPTPASSRGIPRQEREDSSSSLLTVIKHPLDLPRSASLSSKTSPLRSLSTTSGPDNSDDVASTAGSVANAAQVAKPTTTTDPRPGGGVRGLAALFDDSHHVPRLRRRRGSHVTSTSAQTTSNRLQVKKNEAKDVTDGSECMQGQDHSTPLFPGTGAIGGADAGAWTNRLGSPWSPRPLTTDTNHAMTGSDGNGAGGNDNNNNNYRGENERPRTATTTSTTTRITAKRAEKKKKKKKQQQS